MNLSQSVERALTVVMASSRRPGVQPILNSHTVSTILMRHFSWGSRHKWNCKFIGTDRKTLMDKINKASPDYSYLHEQKMFARRFRGARGWRSSSDWKKPTSNDSNKDKDKGVENDTSKLPGGINSEDWFTTWQLQRLQNFEAFKKKIDKDPYMAIFGGSDKLLRWASEKIESTAAELEEQLSDSPKVSKKETEKVTKNERVKKSMNDVQDQSVLKTKEKANSQIGPELNRSTKDPEEKEYDIDPITLRKIAKKENQVSSPKETTPTKATSKGFEIPVKKFQPSSSFASPSPKSSMLSKGHGYSQADEWLAREGFRASASPTAKHKSVAEKETAIKSDLPKSKIESSLDRHLKENSSADTKKPGVTSKSETEMNDEGVGYSSKGNIQAGVSNGDNVVESNQNQALNRNLFESRSEYLRRLLKEDLELDESNSKDSKLQSKISNDGITAASSRASETLEAINKRYMHERPDVDGAATVNSAPQAPMQRPEDVKAEKLSRFGDENTRRIQSLLLPLKTQINLMTADYETLRRKWLEATRRLREKQAKKVAEQSKLLHQEIEAQKLAMKAAEERHREDKSGKGVEANKGVESSEATEFNKEASDSLTTTSPSAEHHHGEGDLSANVGDFASRDRYYKRKAPHANCEMEAKTQRIARELALVGELRSIYEDTYGTIDTNHRQPSIHQTRGEGDMDPSVVNLAYPGRWYKQPASFNTTSNAKASKPVAKEEAHHPIGAEGDLCPNVVNLAYPNRWYKRAAPFHTLLKDDPSPSLLSETDTTTTTTTTTADLRAQLAAQSRELAGLRAALSLRPPPTVSKPETVKRTEPVFSGSRRGGTRGERRRAARERRRATLKHVVWTGAVTAGVCYAVGVAAEWAGGSGGL